MLLLGKRTCNSNRFDWRRRLSLRTFACWSFSFLSSAHFSHHHPFGTLLLPRVQTHWARAYMFLLNTRNVFPNQIEIRCGPICARNREEWFNRTNGESFVGGRRQSHAGQTACSVWLLSAFIIIPLSLCSTTHLIGRRHNNIQHVVNHLTDRPSLQFSPVLWTCRDWVKTIAAWTVAGLFIKVYIEKERE